MINCNTGSCALTPNNVVTFDNQKYSAKLSDCETLVAADCSEWPDFAVYAKTTASKKLVNNYITRKLT